MAALPGAYSAILSDLNRDVLRAQPSDLLQFCFSWFGQRLEHERAIARRQQQQQGQQGQGQQQFGYQRDGGSREASPASGTIAMSTSTATTDDDAPRSINSKLSFVDKSFTFGSSSGINMDDRAGSPGAGARPAYSSVDPSGPYRSGSPFSAPPSTTAAAAAAAGEPSQISPRKASAFGAYQQQQQQQQQHAPSSSSRPPNDDREDDTDDDDADAPPPGWRGGGGGAGGGGPFGGAGALSVDDGGIPAGYNLGRRTSVSAESLDPTSAASTAAAAVALPKTVIPKTASQVARIEGSIKGNLLFRNLDEDQHKDVINAMKEVVVRAGTEVIVQGAVGDFFYVVEEGSFEAWVRGPPTHTYAGPGQVTTTPGQSKRVATYGPGGSFGELALMYNAPRAASVVATSDAVVWALDRVTFRAIVVAHTSRKRKTYELFLEQVPILATLDARERAKVADALDAKAFDEGLDVVTEGEPGEDFYIIESGRAVVVRKKKTGALYSDKAPQGFEPAADTGAGHQDDEEEILGTLGRGDYFGELALINRAPRAATVRAMPGHGRLRVATLGEQAFTRLLGPVIDILARKAETRYTSGPLGPGVAE